MHDLNEQDRRLGRRPLTAEQVAEHVVLAGRYLAQVDLFSRAAGSWGAVEHQRCLVWLADRIAQLAAPDANPGLVDSPGVLFDRRCRRQPLTAEQVAEHVAAARRELEQANSVGERCLVWLAERVATLEGLSLPAVVGNETSPEDPIFKILRSVLGSHTGKLRRIDVLRICELAFEVGELDMSQRCRLDRAMRELGWELQRGAVDGRILLGYVKGSPEQREVLLTVGLDPHTGRALVAIDESALSRDVNRHAYGPSRLATPSLRDLANQLAAFAVSRFLVTELSKKDSYPGVKLFVLPGGRVVDAVLVHAWTSTADAELFSDGTKFSASILGAAQSKICGPGKQYFWLRLQREPVGHHGYASLRFALVSSPADAAPVLESTSAESSRVAAAPEALPASQTIRACDTTCLHPKILSFLCNELACREDRQCTAVDLFFRRGNALPDELLRVWSHEGAPTLFNGYADLDDVAATILELATDALDQTPGEFYFTLRAFQVSKHGNTKPDVLTDVLSFSLKVLFEGDVVRIFGDPLDVQYDGMSLWSLMLPTDHPSKPCSFCDVSREEHLVSSGRDCGKFVLRPLTPVQRTALSEHWSGELRARIAAVPTPGPQVLVQLDPEDL